MGVYVYDFKEDILKFNSFSTKDHNELLNFDTITIEEFEKTKNRNNRYMIVIDNVEFKDKKPIIYSKEKAELIFKTFACCTRSYYVHPSVIDQEFIDWFVEKYPLDIISLPLEEIDFDMAYKALLAVLEIVLNKVGIANTWFSNIFRDMPNKFKDEYMCEWAYIIDPNLILYFPPESEFISYDLYYDLPDSTNVCFGDVPEEYRDETMRTKFKKINKYYSIAKKKL